MTDNPNSEHIQALAQYQGQEPKAPADLVERAVAITVTDQSSAERASSLRNDIAELRKGIEEAIKPHKQNAHKTWKALCDEEVRQVGPYRELERQLGQKITTWQDAERERVRAEARAELARAEAEAKAERERLAEELRQQGLSKAAAQAEAREQVAAQVYERQVAVATASAPTVAGSSQRRVWVGTVTDLKALCGEIAAGRAPVHLVDAVQSEINRMAAATRGPSPIKGLAFTETSSNVRAGGRR